MNQESAMKQQTKFQQDRNAKVKHYREQREREQQQMEQSLEYQRQIAHSAIMQSEAIQKANDIFQVLLSIPEEPQQQIVAHTQQHTITS